MSRSAAARAEREVELREQYRAAKARALEDAGEPELAEDVRAGRCACGCKAPVRGGNVRTFYVDERHRKRLHRRRLEALAEARGIPARLSRRALEQGNGKGDRPGDAPARRPRRKTGPRPGVTAYLPTLAAAIAVARALEQRRDELTASELEALEALESALERKRRRMGLAA